MNTRRIFCAAALTALVATGAFAVPADVVPSMVALDKKYIAALG